MRRQGARLIARLYDLTELHQQALGNALCSLVGACVASGSLEAEHAAWCEWMQESASSGSREVVIATLCAHIVQMLPGQKDTVGHTRAILQGQERCASIFAVLQAHCARFSQKEKEDIDSMCVDVMRVGSVHPSAAPFVYSPLLRVAAVQLLQRSE